MRTSLSFSLIVVVAVSASTLVVGGAEREGKGTSLEARFRQLDRNADGKVTREEAGDAAWFDRLDRDGDGSVTMDEVRVVTKTLARATSTSELPAQSDHVTREPAENSPRVGPKRIKPTEAGVGRRVSNFAFTDIEGKPGTLAEYRSAKALVIALTSTSCPLTKKFAPTLARLEKEFLGRGVVFLYVVPIASDSAADIRAAIRDQGFSGRTVQDRDGRLAAALGAKTTTEAFVIDGAGTLVFRGAVDDQYGLGYSLDAPRETYLRDALGAVVAGKVPPVAATEAPGCVLERAVPPAVAGTAGAPVTFHNQIARIVQNNCLECHRSGGVAPFSLATYEDVRAHAGMIRKQVARDAMPPWFAAPAAPGEASHWINDRSLEPADKAALLTWLAGDKPVGDPADAPLPRTFPEGWNIGQPDTVLELPRAVAIKADGVMPYQVLRVETRFAEDRWVQAYEIQPTAREVVHHVIVKVHARGSAAAAGTDGNVASEREGYFAAYVPGNAHAIFPAGFAKKIPAGATVSFQMHYTPNGKATTDQTRLGLVFSAAPPRHVIHVAGLANGRIRIPAGAADHPETAGLTLPFDATLLGFMPHMHVRGKAARYEVVLPDGVRRVLLDVPRYDFNWQLPYHFAEPPTLPRGSRLIYTAWYDNSAGNPANPDPTKLVRWGPQTFDEMMLGYVEYYVPGERNVAMKTTTPTPRTEE
ncbi:redoxin domain-containing protein [Horticoccus sp. 23ND18S-11]|uniref:redoxin domain-containing protein n=1 Tax=Horticoccus sp. 23ND18S-11 TaxID=3391832 RepID=UPI0039C9013C